MKTLAALGKKVLFEIAFAMHANDAEREFAYDRDFRVSPLAEALDRSVD